MSGAVGLGGKRFVRVENSTVRHDFWLMAQARKAGLNRIEAKAGGTVEDFVDEILGRLLDSDMVFVLLGGLLVPEGLDMKDWTPKVAEDVSRHLELLTSQEDKEAIKPLTASMLIGFFRSGIASLRTSQPSSPEGSQENDPSQTGRPADGE
jgi:hypothetical protein